ncbi:MAG: hypothetical protein ACYCYO_18055 [Bacilli bacterium]
MDVVSLRGVTRVWRTIGSARRQFRRQPGSQRVTLTIHRGVMYTVNVFGTDMM